MSEKGKMVKHTGILMGMELGTRILDIIISMIVARYLGPKGFGLLAFAVSFGALFSIIPGFGMGSLIIRDISRDRDQISRYLIHGLAAKIFLAGLMLAIVAVVAKFMNFSSDKIALVMTACFLVIWESNIRFATAFFQALQLMSKVAYINLAIRVGWVLGSLSVMGLHGSVLDLISIRCFINFIGFSAAIYLVMTQLQKLKWQWDVKFVFHMITASFPFALFRMFGTVYTDLDTVMLSAMRGDVMTGWYAAAQKFYRVITFIPSSFAGTMLPLLSNLAGKDRPKFVSSLKSACKFLLVIAFPIVVVGCVMAFDVTKFFYGKAFVESSSALQILMLAVPFAFLNEVLISAVAALDREKKGSNCLLLGALFSGLSNLIVIPLFGHLGAAVTTAMAEAMVFFLQMRILRKDIPGFQLRSDLIRPFAAALVMTAVIFLVRGFGLIPALCLSLPAYAAATLLLRVLTPEEWGELKGLFKFKSRKSKKIIPEDSGGDIL